MRWSARVLAEGNDPIEWNRVWDNVFLPHGNVLRSWASRCFGEGGTSDEVEACARAAETLLAAEVLQNAESATGPGAALLEGLVWVILAAEDRRTGRVREANHNAMAANAYQRVFGRLGTGAGETAVRVVLDQLLGESSGRDGKRPECGFILGNVTHATLDSARFWAQAISGPSGMPVPDPLALGMQVLGAPFHAGILAAWRRVQEVIGTGRQLIWGLSGLEGVRHLDPWNDPPALPPSLEPRIASVFCSAARGVPLGEAWELLFANQGRSQPFRAFVRRLAEAPDEVRMRVPELLSPHGAVAVTPLVAALAWIAHGVGTSGASRTN